MSLLPPGSLRVVISFPVATFHNEMWPALSEDAKVLPSGLNATETISGALGSLRVVVTVLAAKFHSQMVPSPPTATGVPSGLHPTVSAPPCPGSVRAPPSFPVGTLQR